MELKNLKNAMKQWWILFVAVLLALGLWLFDRGRGTQMVDVTLYSLKEMLIVLPPIFIILGLLDVWVPREQMIRFMGEDSGLKGIMLAILLGSAAAGPLYAAFPVAQVFLKKGASLRNVLILLGAWSTTKIPMLMFELSNLGTRFTVTRLVVDIAGVLLIAWIMDRILGQKDRAEIMGKAR